VKTIIRTFLGVVLAASWLTIRTHAAEGQQSEDQVRQLYNLPPTNAAPGQAAPATNPPTAAPTTPAAPADLSSTNTAGFALPTNTPPSAPAPASPADLGAAPSPTGEAEEVLPLVTFGSEVTLQAAIQTLARQANLNLHIDQRSIPPMIGPDGKPVTASASVHWENVTARQALDELLDINGLTLSLNPKTRIYRVVGKPTAEPRLTQVFQLQYANPTNMVLVVSNSFGTTVKVIHDPRTSRLIVNAVERDLDSISNLLSNLDTPTKQVLIEAEILETTKNPNSVKGIDWAGTLEAQNVSFGNGNTAFTSTTTTPGSTGSTGPGGRPTSGGDGSTTSSSAVSTLSTAGNLVGFSANTARGLAPNIAFLNADGARAVLSFLNKETDSDVLATPKAVTSDNEPAILSVTRAFPIFKNTPGTSQTPAGSEIQYTNMGTILTVTPRISQKGSVAMKVVPEVSSIDSKDRQTINGQVNEANVYAIRKVEAHVVVPSGNTLVMGGLISDSTTSTFSKVPVLGDLPGVGLAFRRQGKQRSKSNLMVFITPTIVDDADFVPASTEFLKSKRAVPDKREDSAWDSGHPHDWLKPVK